MTEGSVTAVGKPTKPRIARALVNALASSLVSNVTTWLPSVSTNSATNDPSLNGRTFTSKSPSTSLASRVACTNSANEYMTEAISCTSMPSIPLSESTWYTISQRSICLPILNMTASYTSRRSSGVPKASQLLPAPSPSQAGAAVPGVTRPRTGRPCRWPARRRPSSRAPRCGRRAPWRSRR